MSELQNPTSRPVAPSQAPNGPGKTDGAAEVYRRAIEAKPTGFAENPIGAMAQAVDRLGKAAGGVLAGKAMEGRDGLADGEARLKAAVATMRAEGTPQAKQQALAAGLSLLEQMSSLAPNDPRRLAVAKFVVGLANELGAAGNLPTTLGSLDVRGLLRVAAQLLSRFGTPQDMQAAFQLEHLVTASLPAGSAQALAVRDELMKRLGLSSAAQALLRSGWGVRLATPGEVPKLDMSARTIVLDALQQNPSLGVLARAYWHDRTLRAPSEKDGFMEAFQKIANQGAIASLSRKYREVREHARRELQQSRVGIGAASAGPRTDESADMFGSLAVFSHGDGEGAELPEELREPLTGFFAPR